ncbi:hypothetical protein FRB96_001604 [Tulasnella sp. 330]|nr:hypothetical protein FRB96_001604 [Tulasnella sp. 330]
MKAHHPTKPKAETDARAYRSHWLYVWTPAFIAFVWFGPVLALLITWLASGRPHYVSMSQRQAIACISDVAADFLKPLFIVWHSGRLLPEHQKRERVMSGPAYFGAALGALGLILLPIFDSKHHSHLHRVFLLVFLFGVALSAIFTVIEFRWLNKDFGENVAHLNGAYIAKTATALILIVLAVAFAALLDVKQKPPAVVEWTIAFGYTFYLMTF